MLLHRSTWIEVEEYLKRSKGMIIPIGSTEQHGPMGLIGTDAICPEKIAHEISAKYDVLVAPTINIGMSQHHLAFPGSITLRPSTLVAMVKDIVKSVQRHGITHIFFLNGHGGNVDSLRVAFSEIYAENSFADDGCTLHCQAHNWYEGKKMIEISNKYFKGSEGAHATPSEISLSFYAHPDSVKTAVLNPQIAVTGNFRDSIDYRNTFPDGRIGSDSSLATVDIGKEICSAAVAEVYDHYCRFLKN